MAFTFAMMISVSAFSHDPLSDAHGQHDDHFSDSRRTSHQRVNLSAVRDLLISFRESGDDRDLDDAWRRLAPTLESSTDPDTLIVASTVAQSRHQFDYAEHLISEALAINPNNDEGWLLLASIRLVRGEAESAAMACAHLRKVPPLVTLTCNARVALARGEHHLAFERLHTILQVADLQRLPPDIRAWSYSVAGDLAVADGQLRQAKTLYAQSLLLADRTQVRAALVDVLISQAQHQRAWLVLEDGSLALPLLMRRLIVAKRLGRAHELQPVLLKVQQQFAEWIADEDWLHAREMARFYLDVDNQPDLARRLALINISLQQEPEDQRLERRTRLNDANPGNILVRSNI